MKSSLIRQNDNFWDNAFRGFFTPFGYESSEKGIMRTDIKEDGENYVMEIDIPGFKKEDINIDLKNGYVTISAEKSDKEENDKYLRKERYVSFSRSYYVGDNLTEEDFKAKYENGVLELQFPKEKETKETNKKILIA